MSKEVIQLICRALFTFGVVGVVAILALFTDIHWGWIIFIAFVAIGVLENDYMRNIGDSEK